MSRRLEHCARMGVAEGTIYPLLGRLERAEFIEAEWMETGFGHPRKYYTLTAAGFRRTLEMTLHWSAFTRNPDHLLSATSTSAARSSQCGRSAETDPP